jgi:hypothetical protein
MKAKVILIDPANNETLVATFKSDIEAFQAASLFQALTVTNGYVYRIEHKHNGVLRRTAPQPFTQVVGNSPHLHELLDPLYPLS